MRNWSANTEQTKAKGFFVLLLHFDICFHTYMNMNLYVFTPKTKQKTLQIFSLLVLQKSSIYIWAENRSKRVRSLITNLLSVISICSLITTLLSVTSAMDFDAKWLPPWLKDIHHVHRLCSRQCRQKSWICLPRLTPTTSLTACSNTLH